MPPSPAKPGPGRLRRRPANRRTGKPIDPTAAPALARNRPQKRPLQVDRGPVRPGVIPLDDDHDVAVADDAVRVADRKESERPRADDEGGIDRPTEVEQILDVGDHDARRPGL